VKGFVILSFGIVVAGCATSSVVQVGPDTYTLSAKRCDVCEPAAGAASEQAGKYCVAQGKFLIVRNMSVVQEFGHDIATINFSCVTADDPEYKRPNAHKDDGAPSVNH
jgi:hypothetical protein